MWLLDYITQNGKNGKPAEKGKVNASSAEGMGVVASNSFRALKQVLPYGIVSVPPNGEDAVVIPLSDSQVCLGTICENKNVQPGEILLFSKGGAEIYLCNDGKVYINGVEL